MLHELPVAAVDPLTEDSVAITFAVPAELRDAYRFIQGQHLSVRCAAAGDDLRRSYSISSPAGSGRLSIGVKRIPGGVFSGYAMSRLRPGDVLEVMTPVGGFHVPLDPSLARRHVAIAAGSGVTPVLSIAATTLAEEPASEFTLILGNRGAPSIMFLEELEDLKDRHPARFTLHHVLSGETRESELLSGRIDASKLRRFLGLLEPATGVDHWFLCGPAPLVALCRAVLGEHGVAPGRVHAELFHVETASPRRSPDERAGERPPDASTAGATIRLLLDGRESTVSVLKEGEVILDAALRVRADTPYSCRDGVCGTCRARVVAGEVRMDRCHALEASEVEAGFVLACQSHPVSDGVTLDFDA